MSKKDREGNRSARAAAIQKAQVTRERTRKILIVAVVLLSLAAIVTAGVLSSRGDGPTKGEAAGSSTAVSGQALVVGTSPDAATKVVVYEDFLCAFCREFESASRTLLRDAAERGDVLLEYRPFNLLRDDYSTMALTAWAAVAEGSTAEQALAFHDLLFENQPYENAAEKPGVEDLTDLAKDAGVKDQSVLDAFGRANPDFVGAADTTAADAGVRGTPTVIVNGARVESTSISDLVNQVEQLIAKG